MEDKEDAKIILSSNDPKEWVSISRAEKLLGISREDINTKIKEGKIPFRKSGSRYTVNIKLVRAYLCREDINNMKQVQRSINLQPFSKENHAKNVNGRGRPKSEPRVRKIDF